MPVAVRRATKADAPAVAEYAMKLIEQHIAYDQKRFSPIGTLKGMTWFYGSQTEAENAAVFVAEDDGRIIGFLYVGYEEISYQDLAARTAWVHDIYIDPAARNRGAGQALIYAAVGFAKERGATKLLLWTAESNVEAQSFFEQAGFVPTMREMMLELGD